MRALLMIFIATSTPVCWCVATDQNTHTFHFGEPSVPDCPVNQVAADFLLLGSDRIIALHPQVIETKQTKKTSD